MILIRADLSPARGWTALRRSAYLAALLKRHGQVRLLCRPDKPTAKFLAGARIPHALVQDPAAVDLAGARLLAFDLDSVTGQDGALLEKARRAGVRTALLAPPGAQQRLEADLVVDPALEPASALLHHKFRHFHRAKRKFRGRPRLVFVNLGDALPYRRLRQVVDVLHRLRFRLRIEPGAALKKADKRNLARIYPGIRFRGMSESPARAYFEADLALIPPGDEALEAACVGTPALYLPLEKGQDAMADAWTARGLGVKAPLLEDFSPQSFRAAADSLDQETRARMGAAGKALVDGLGVQRFMAQLLELIHLETPDVRR